MYHVTSLSVRSKVVHAQGVDLLPHSGKQSKICAIVFEVSLYMNKGKEGKNNKSCVYDRKKEK